MPDCTDSWTALGNKSDCGKKGVVCLCVLQCPPVQDCDKGTDCQCTGDSHKLSLQTSEATVDTAKSITKGTKMPILFVSRKHSHTSSSIGIWVSVGRDFPSEFSRLRDSLQNASANHAFLSFAIKLMTSPLPTELQNQLGYNSHNTGRWEKYELFQAHF